MMEKDSLIDDLKLQISSAQSKSLSDLKVSQTRIKDLERNLAHSESKYENEIAALTSRNKSQNSELCTANVSISRLTSEIHTVKQEANRRNSEYESISKSLRRDLEESERRLTHLKEQFDSQLHEMKVRLGGYESNTSISNQKVQDLQRSLDAREMELSYFKHLQQQYDSSNNSNNKDNTHIKRPNLMQSISYTPSAGLVSALEVPKAFSKDSYHLIGSVHQNSKDVDQSLLSASSSTTAGRISHSVSASALAIRNDKTPPMSHGTRLLVGGFAGSEGRSVTGVTPAPRRRKIDLSTPLGGLFD